MPIGAVLLAVALLRQDVLKQHHEHVLQLCQLALLRELALQPSRVGQDALAVVAGEGEAHLLRDELGDLLVLGLEGGLGEHGDEVGDHDEVPEDVD